MVQIVLIMMIREIPSDFKRLYSKEDIGYSDIKWLVAYGIGLKILMRQLQQVLAICVYVYSSLRIY